MSKRHRYGFWGYDLCPYILGGAIEKFKKGVVFPVGSQGRGYLAMRVMHGRKGRVALRKLNELWAEYRRREKALKDEFSAKAKALIK